MQVTFKWIDANQLLKLVVFILISFFLCVQAWDQSPTTDAAILLWVIGLGLTISSKGEHQLNSTHRKICIAAALVFLSSLLSWIFSDYQVNSRDIEPDLRFLLMPLAIIAVKRAGIDINMLGIALILGGISYGLSALYERHELGVFRVNGDENAVTFGNGAFLIFSCISYLFFSEVKKHILYFAPIGMGMALIAAIYSGTRGSFLGLIPLTLAAFFLAQGGAKLVVISISSLLIIVLLQFPQITTGIKISENALNAYFDHENTNTSIGQRLLQWEKAICMTAKHPLLGSGPRTFKDHMLDPESECSFQAPTSTGYYNQAHSVYFQTLSTKGILGLTSLLLFFAYIIRASRAGDLPARYILLAAIISMCSYGIGVDLLFKIFMAERHILLLAILLGVQLGKR